MLHGKYSYARAAERLGSVECRTVDMQDLPHETASGQAIVAAEISSWWECDREVRPCWSVWEHGETSKKGATAEPTSPPLD